MTTKRSELTGGELEALHVLAVGMAGRSVRNISDPDKGLRGVHSKSADGLIKRGLARDVRQWGAVEILPAGRTVLAGGEA